MQVTVESTGTLERRMRVELPAERIDNEVDSRLKAWGRKAKIKGFRPGKVPAKVVKQRYGKQIREEVLNELMQKSFSDALVQENLNPAGGPRLEPAVGSDDTKFAYVATFEIMPEFELKDLDKIKVEKPDVQISDSDLDEMILKLRKQKATWEEVDRASDDGDRVVCDFEGTLKGEAFEGGTGKEIPVILGAGQMLPDFEKGLHGVKPGEEKSIKVKFPKDYHAEDLAGKKVDFAIKVHRVEEEVLPPVDDELAKMFEVSEGGIEQFMKDVRENMEREAQQAITNRMKEQLFDGLMKLDLMEIPKALIDSEIEALIKQRQEAMQQYGGGAQVQDVKPSEFEEQAKRRVTLGLVLAEAIQKNEIKVPPAKLREKVEQIAASYERPDDVVKYYYSDKSRLSELENVALEEMAVEKLLEETKVSDKKTTFDALMNPGQTAS